MNNLNKIGFLFCLIVVVSYWINKTIFFIKSIIPFFYFNVFDFLEGGNEFDPNSFVFLLIKNIYYVLRDYINN